jgi:thiopurine S-methyltransferase
MRWRLRQLSVLLPLLVASISIAMVTAIMGEDVNIITSSNNNNSEDDNCETSNENLKPWYQRWDSRRIGFHLKDVNPIIVKYLPELLKTTSTTCEAADVDVDYTTTTSDEDGEKQHRRIFVPLCGKAVDMAYLASSSSSSSSLSSSVQLEVVGLEGIRVALEEFIQEHPNLNIKPIITTNNNANGENNNNRNIKLEQFVGDNITLLKGDYFDLLEEDSSSSSSSSSSSASIIGKFDYIYDRGSMVAIEPQLRASYVKILKSLLKPGGKVILVALERKSTSNNIEATKKGPPYSIDENNIRELFSCDGDDDKGNNDNWIESSITLLEETDQLVIVPEDKLRYPDLDQLLEAVYLIQRKR